jgi:hypothetical protein
LGYYDDGVNPGCQKCHPSCAVCESSGDEDCLQCNPGFWLSN